MNETERNYRRYLGVKEADTVTDIEHLIQSEGWSVRWAQSTHEGGKVWHNCRLTSQDGVEMPTEGDPRKEIAALHALDYVRHINPRTRGTMRGVPD